MEVCDLASAVLIALTTVPGVPVAGLLGLLLVASLLTPISGGARAGLLSEILPPSAIETSDASKSAVLAAKQATQPHSCRASW